ncbi:MAG: T9SS type A sorting domain-containing protein [Bacteroidota bacterium]
MEAKNLLFQRMEFLKLRRLGIFILMLMMFGMYNSANAQIAYMAEAQQDGFTLKKVESNTSIMSGQTFSYTIYFSIPAGATNVTITDVLPGGLEYLGSSFTAPGITPTVVTPAVNSMGGTYSLAATSVPGGCSGSITITVRFPNGTTCDGTTARNRACISGVYQGKDVSFCTGFINVTAIASNPWHINKYPVGVSYVGGTCPYASGDSVVTYQLQVYKDVGTTGQLNLVNGVVRDTLPAGAILQSSTCGATQSGNVITWNVGNQSATSMYNWQTCNFTIVYPPALFPSGTNLLNKATLTGTLGSANASCGNVNLTSNQTCVQLLAVESAQLSKYVYTNGQPGCASKYLIYICNNGTTTLSSFIGRDTLPTGISAAAVGTVSSGLTATLTGGIVTITSTSALAPGQCRSVEITFTIPAGATVGSTITNCVTLTSTATPSQFTPQRACATFTVTAPAAKACVWKEVCNEQTSYTPGATFRYRLRVQNIGGQAITGATITDALDTNLTYVGNPSYYTSANWNVPCQTTSNWTGVTLNFNSTTNVVTATLPSIGAVCQNFFYGNCGQYGSYGVPFYFIEFDVQVKPTSALGNIPNNFTLNGGSITTPVISNTDYVTVVGTTGFTLSKGVRANAGSPYAATANTSAGGIVDYQLKMNIATGTAALRFVTFADELPRNNNTADRTILGSCATRGSQYDITYASFITSSSAIATQFNQGTTADVNVNGLTVPTVGALFSNGCGTVTTAWPTTITAGAKNFAYYFGSAPMAGTVTAEFKGTVSPTATPQQNACNTFAANGAVAHLINSTTTNFVKAGALESQTACVRIDSTTKPTGCDLWKEGKQDEECCKFEGTLSNGGASISSIQYNVLSGGVVQSFTTNPCTPSSTVPASLLNTTSGTLNYTGCSSPLNFSINAAANTPSGVVCIELIATTKNAAGVSTVCKDTVCIKCIAPPPPPKTKCDSMKVLPYLFGNLNQSWRTFKVFNQKIPLSPIKQIRITLTPDPVPGSPTVKWTGGGLAVSPGTINTWTVSNSNNAGSPIEYSLIDLKCSPTTPGLLNNTAPISNWVQFNLGIDFTRNWSGTVTVTTIHCDGDTCINTYNWCAKQNPNDCKKILSGTGILAKDSIKTKLFASRFRVKGDEKAKIRFATIEPDLKDGAQIFAAGLGQIPSVSFTYQKIEWEYMSNNERRNYAVRLEFGDGLLPGDTAEVPIIVELPEKSTAKNVKLRIKLYDENSDIIYEDSIIANSTTTAINDDDAITGRPYGGNAELHPAEPTPTGNAVEFSYWLSSSQNVKLELYDALGKNIASIDSGIRHPGDHTFKYDASNLPSGAYILLLTTPYGVYSQSVIVQH